MNRRPVIAALAVLGLLAAQTADADAAVVGSTVVASGPSRYPAAYSFVGSTSTTFVFQVEDVAHGSDLYVQARDGGARTLIASGVSSASMAGGMVLYAAGSGMRWFDTTSGSSGAAPTTWQVASPNGGLFLRVDSSSGDTHLIDQSTGGTVTDLGAVPGDTQGTILADSAGAAVIALGDGLQGAYVPFGNSDGPVALSATGVGKNDFLYCTSISSTAVGCFDDDSQHVVRVPVNGGPPVSTRVSGYADNVTVTATQTAWMGSNDMTLDYQSAAGGAVTTTSVSGLSGLAADDQMFYFQAGAGLSTAGLYAATDGATTPTRVLASDPLALVATTVAAGPGRVAWTDDQRTDHPLWARSLSSNHGSVVAGGPSLLSTSASAIGLDVSGTRVGAALASGAELITHGSTVQRISNVVTLDEVDLSGSRLLYLGVDGKDVHYFLRDLNSGHSTDLTKTLGLTHIPADHQQVSLWGNYVSYIKSDNSVWRKDLTSRHGPVELVAGQKHAQGGSVSGFGDWVAWTRYTSSSTNSGFRNARTLAKANALPAGSGIASASVGGVVLATESEHFELVPWTGGSAQSLPGSAQWSAPNYTDGIGAPVVSGSTVAWVGGDGEPRVGSLSQPVSDRPRSLGNGMAPSTLHRGHTWSFDLVTSAPLTSCAVVIRDRSGHQARRLSCNAAASAMGEIVTSWDGTTSSGKPAGYAKYSWTVVAGNSSGSLLSAGGTTSATGGSITFAK